MPRPIATLIENVTYGIAWITLPLSFLNTVTDLRVVAEGVQWLYLQAEALRPLLDAASPVLVAILAAWRQITEPFHAWLLSWLPFAVPVHLADLLIVAALVIPSVVRVLSAQRAHGDAANRNFQARMYERGEVDDDGKPYEPAETTAGPESKWHRRMRLRRAQLLVAVAVVLAVIAVLLIGLDAWGGVAFS